MDGLMYSPEQIKKMENKRCKQKDCKNYSKSQTNNCYLSFDYSFNCQNNKYKKFKLKDIVLYNLINKI